MIRRSRRTILCGTAGLFALSAGCLDEAGVSGDDSNGTDDPEPNGDGAGSGGNGDDDGDSGTGGNAGSESVETVPFTDTGGPDSGPNAELFARADRITDWLEERDRDTESLLEFVSETVFEDSVIVAVEADTPTPCYELALESITLDTEASTLDLEAAVSEDLGESESCPQVESVAGQLVRAPIAGDPSVSVTITDRYGEVHEIGIGADSDSESASDSDHADENEN